MPENDNYYSPYTCEDIDKDSWHENMPVPIILAKLWNKYIPRGKGWFPRFMGQLFCKNLKNYYIKTKYGAYLAIEPSSLDIYMHILNNGRTWNEHVFDACNALLSNGGVFYDIGANIGYMSIEMASIYGNKVSVMSFEPQPLLAKVISLSSKLNGFENVKVFDLMIGDKHGEAYLYVVSHSIHASAVSREKHSACIKRQISTIDDMIETGSIPPPNVIKIDIEGGELAALSGASATIASYHPYIIFESDVNMDRFGYTRKDVLDLIKATGPYDFFYIAGTKSKIVKIEEENLSLGFSDILAIPK
jgi:FkbM family methyltransferase